MQILAGDAARLWIPSKDPELPVNFIGASKTLRSGILPRTSLSMLWPARAQRRERIRGRPAAVVYPEDWSLCGEDILGN